MPIINPGTGGGSPGPQGPQGIQGFPGFDGDSGEDGLSIPGSAGPAGATGSQGVPGINGSQGIPGEDGLDGLDSFVPGLQGIQGIQGVRGADGEDGLTNDDFWPGFNPFIDDPLEQISRVQDQNLTILPKYSAIVVGPYTINSGKKLTIGSGGRFKIEQGASPVNQIQAAEVSLTNNQILTLPTVTIRLVLAPGVGKALIPLSLFWRLDTSAGQYSNVNAGAVTQLAWQAADGSLMSPLFKTQLAMNSNLGTPRKSMGLEELASTFFDSLSVPGILGNFPIGFQVTNSSAGNFTSGNAANTMKLTLLYYILKL